MPQPSTPTSTPAHSFFDAHLDLAYLTELGRDMHTGLADCRGKLLPAAVTLPSLRDGRVRGCLGTIFTEAIAPGAQPDAPEAAYPVGDTLAAWRAGMRQLKLYHAWRDAGVIALIDKRGGRTPSNAARTPLLLGILMECADPIETPDQLDEWVEGGVVAIGMAWWRGSRYAAGNGAKPNEDAGLTDLGRELATRMDALGLIHDLSHLSQRATDDLLAHTDATVIASHSNCRTLLDGKANPDWQRHLSDDTIAEIGKRGGMIGLNLVRNFIATGLDRHNPNDRPTIEKTLDHVEHVCSVMEHRRGIGLGSDMDGGIKATDLPRGIDSPSDLGKLCEGLQSRGWNEEEIRGFAWENWARFWGIG